MKTKHFIIILCISTLLTIYSQYKTIMLRIAEEDNSIYYTLRNIFFVLYLLSFIAAIISYFYNKKKNKKS